MRSTPFRLTIVAAALFFAAPLTTSGQPAARVPRVGSLSTGVSTTGASNPFWEALQALGYIAGKTIILEVRYAEGRVNRLPALAAELVQLNVDVIVAWGVEPLEAVRKATNRIPIVMVARGDPVATGLVASLAKPGGNITGGSPSRDQRSLENGWSFSRRACRAYLAWLSCETRPTSRPTCTRRSPPPVLSICAYWC